MSAESLNAQGRPARKTTGVTSELMAATELHRHGFSVSWPVGDVDPYDLISDSGERILRIQVKGSAVCTSRGTWRISFSKGYKTKVRYTKKECDYFIAVLLYPDGPAYYIVPIEAATSSHYTFWPAGQHPRWPHKVKWRTCGLEEYRDRWDLLR